MSRDFFCPKCQQLDSGECGEHTNTSMGAPGTTCEVFIPTAVEHRETDCLVALGSRLWLTLDEHRGEARLAYDGEHWPVFLSEADMIRVRNWLLKALARLEEL